MNKIQYNDAFSKVHPSDKTLERIFDMTKKKHNVTLKTLAIVMALIAVLCSFSIAANAATDGAIKDAVSEAAETVSRKINVLVNGEETETNINITEITDEKGNSSYIAGYQITSLTGDTGSIFENEIDEIDKLLIECIEENISSSE